MILSAGLQARKQPTNKKTMVSSDITQKFQERILLRTAGLKILANKGVKGSTSTLLAESMNLPKDDFKRIFRDKNTLIEEICDYYGPNCSGSNIINNDLMDEMENPYTFLRNFVIKLVKKWDEPGDRLFIKFLLNEQPITYDNHVITLSNYMNEARSLWWMIFEEMIHSGLIKNMDPVLLAHEFLSPLFMCRIENQMPHSDKNFSYIQDTALAHLAFLWELIKPESEFYL